MEPPRKRRRKTRPAPAADEWALPADLLLEIAARSDPATFVRSAAACKLLRRDILDPSFIRRVTQHGGAVPPYVLVYLHNRQVRGRSQNRNLEPLISLVHPATKAASSFTDGNLAPYTLRHSFDILRRYEPLTSRGGLVVLRRRCSIPKSRMAEPTPCLCVFNPVTGDCTYLPSPPVLYPYSNRPYILLTEADGIGCPFLLLVTNVHLWCTTGAVRVEVQTAKTSENGGTSWGPATSAAHHVDPFGLLLQDKHEPVILHGGIIHWLLITDDGDQVLTYDIRTERLGSLKLPPTTCRGSQRLLGKSPDGRLRFLAAKRFMVSVWMQHSDGWVKEAAIDVEQQLRSLNPDTSPAHMLINFECSRERSGAVLLRVYRERKRRRRSPLIVLDLETKEMRILKSCPSSYPPSLLF
ncbi:hypothetical protein ACQ4PT_000303 [Festuca glaucescens]